ncbi:MAG: TetR/AcrR family transcriptional regulator [Sedimentisphaerales bacterium]|nr:TetR/AcrR family transcriptional regulator [Sedimentisphaerales bacterium]
MTNTISRREREKLRHRGEILDAAEAVFAEKGFHRTTVDDIAARSEFAVGTIYNFFSSKDELYRILIEDRFRLLRDNVTMSMAQADGPVETIKAFIDTKIQLSRKYIGFARLYTRERLGDRFTESKLWWETVAPYHDEVMDQLTQTFKEGIEQGCFRNDIEPADMTTALDGLTEAFMFEWFMFPEKTSFLDKFEVMVRLFFEGVKKRG